MIVIDGYIDLERIGQGGLGDVYRATRVSTGGTVAIKVLRDVSDQSVTWHRTRRELTALVALAGHANVIQLLELIDQPSGAGAAEMAPALVMEYAPGGSIAELMGGRPDGLTPAEIVLIGRHTASALAAAHAQGIVHRDVKPQNLLVDGYGQVKLCDFGVAALTRSEEFQVHTNALSMRYASPEDLDEEGDVGTPADVYSLGATLLHLVHDAPPTLKERLAPWVPPTDSVDGVDGVLDGIIASCLHPAPSMRPSAVEVLERFDALDRSLSDRVRALPVTIREEARRSPSAPVAPVGDADARDRTDATLYRAGRQPRAVATAADVTEPRSAWKSWTVPVALAGVVLVAAALGWWWSGSDGGAGVVSGPNTTASAATVVETTVGSPNVQTQRGTDTVERPAGLPPIAEAVWPFGDPGECLVQVEGTSELAPIDCAEPHDLQRYAVASLNGAAFAEDAEFDVEAVRAAVASACEAAYEPFTGVPFEIREFDTPFTAPSAGTWATGDRRYQCFVGVDGARLVGDATG